jgi:hypothetical protein
MGWNKLEPGSKIKNPGVWAMSAGQKSAKTLVDKMRTNTEQEKRKTWAKPWSKSRKKVPKNRQKT